jgi:hypothetical protein
MAFGVSEWLGGPPRACTAACLVAAASALASCEHPPREGAERVVVKGTTFWVEGAFDDPTRIRGLGGRASLPADGGMLFVFPHAQPMEFVMRDCLIDIDIAFMDDAGRVVATHTMTVEPRRPAESDIAYEARLKRYPSRYPARFALELNAGTLARLGLNPGDVIELDAEALKKRAK